MTEQLTFEFAELVTPDHAPEATIQQKYDAWAAANPWVLRTLERLVADWLAAGHSRCGLKQMWEVIRWQYGVTTGSPFRADNDFTSRAARALLDLHPEWASAIETRALRAA